MALKLGRLFGIDAEFWLNAQNSYDIWVELQKHKAEIEKVARLEVA